MESTIQTTHPKKRIIFITLGILFGFIGLHNLYIGRINRWLLQGFITCLLWFTVIVPLIVWMWGIYEIITIREAPNGLPLK